MMKPKDPIPRGEEREHTGEGPISKKERLDKDDGRYIIFYSFDSEETQESEDD